MEHAALPKRTLKLKGTLLPLAASAQLQQTGLDARETSAASRLHRTPLALGQQRLQHRRRFLLILVLIVVVVVVVVLVLLLPLLHVGGSRCHHLRRPLGCRGGPHRARNRLIGRQCPDRIVSVESCRDCQAALGRTAPRPAVCPLATCRTLARKLLAC